MKFLIILALLFLSLNAGAQSKIGSGNVKNYQQDMVIKVFEVDGTSAASIIVGSSEATLVDEGVGVWSLQFSKAFERKPIVQVTPLNCAGADMDLLATSGAAIQIGATSTTNSSVAVDCDFHVTVIGFESANEY